MEVPETAPYHSPALSTVTQSVEVADTMKCEKVRWKQGAGFPRVVVLRLDLKVMYIGFFWGVLWPEKGEENLK